jgi:hypothetical protein
MMRAMKCILFFVLLSCGCGGEVAGPLVDGGSDATGDAGSATCDMLLAQLQTQQTEATTCCAQCDIIQCQYQVPGLCCPLTVSVPQSDAGTMVNAVNAYEATLAQIRAQSCSVNCPNVACSTKPTGKCIAGGLMTQGACAQ